MPTSAVSTPCCSSDSCNVCPRRSISARLTACSPARVRNASGGNVHSPRCTPSSGSCGSPLVPDFDRRLRDLEPATGAAHGSPSSAARSYTLGGASADASPAIVCPSPPSRRSALSLLSVDRSAIALRARASERLGDRPHPATGLRRHRPQRCAGDEQQPADERRQAARRPHRRWRASRAAARRRAPRASRRPCRARRTRPRSCRDPVRRWSSPSADNAIRPQPRTRRNGFDERPLWTSATPTATSDHRQDEAADAGEPAEQLLDPAPDRPGEVAVDRQPEQHPDRR